MTKNGHSQALLHPIFQTLSACADELGCDAYVIGGFVRDYLLERGNPKDIDIVVVGSGIALAKKLSEKLPGHPEVTVFKNYGTAMLKYEDLVLEFVGARKESYRAESRNPVVEDGSLQDDQNRRDFTINALAIALNKDQFGVLIDPFNGLEALENKRIETPLKPDETYSDDPLRMLRAIRFASQLNFKIEAESLAAISRNKERISIISNERIVDEINKMMSSDTPILGFSLMHKTGLLPLIMPELTALEGIEEVEEDSGK
jgi:tRNA nucleotidyltransferase/poly(A) polymerase